MYPSDYIYAFASGVNNKCFNDPYNCHEEYIGRMNNWIQKDVIGDGNAWFLSTDSNSPYNEFYLNNHSRMDVTYGGNQLGVYPVLYLPSDTILVGTGSKSRPYQIINPLTIDDLVELANDLNTNYSDGDTKEMYAFSHPKTSQTSVLTDYRYIGSNPNNYITFNDEEWRIIGVFDGKLKIVKNGSIGIKHWDNGSVASFNDWIESTLNEFLNGEYYDGLKNKEIIVDNLYYLGGNDTAENLSGVDFYNFERGLNVFDGRQTNWEGKIAIMYPSDYIYAFANGVNNKCFNDPYNCHEEYTGRMNSWIQKDVIGDGNAWFLSPSTVSQYDDFYLNNYSRIDLGYGGSQLGIYPVLYLPTDIVFSGFGSKENPYVIK